MLTDLVFEQLSAKVDTCIATPDAESAIAIEARSRGAEILVMPTLSSLKSLMQAARIVRRAHAENPFDIIHVHTVKALLVTFLAGPWLLGRTVATLHNVHQRSSTALMLARVPVCVSAAQAGQLRTSYGWLARHTRVIRNGNFDSRRLSPVEAVVAAKMEKPSLLYVGGLNERKGVDLLLRRFDAVHRAVPKAHLYLVGNRDNPEMEKLANGLDSRESIHFEGYSSDPRRFMLAATAMVVPSRREAFGLVVIDARSCSLPIIASKVDGLPEALSDGRAGVLVDPRDGEGWAAEMIKVLTDSAWHAELARRSSAGLEEFSVKKMAEGYAVIYREIAQRSCFDGRLVGLADDVAV